MKRNLSSIHIGCYESLICFSASQFSPYIYMYLTILITLLPGLFQLVFLFFFCFSREIIDLKTFTMYIISFFVAKSFSNEHSELTVCTHSRPNRALEFLILQGRIQDLQVQPLLLVWHLLALW